MSRFGLTIEAADAGEARRTAVEQGLDVLAIKPQNPLGAWLPRPRLGFKLDLFSQELISLARFRPVLVEVIEMLADKEEGKGAAAALTELRDHLYRGQSFSSALEQLPRLFPSMFVATVRAAEKTGDIREAISRYLEYHTQLDRIRRKIVAASVYPVLLLAVGLAGHRLPAVLRGAQVQPHLRGDGQRPAVPDPAPGQLGATARNPCRRRPSRDWHCLSAATAFALTPTGAARLDRARDCGRLPAIGNRMRVYELARFYRTLGHAAEERHPAADGARHGRAACCRRSCATAWSALRAKSAKASRCRARFASTRA